MAGEYPTGCVEVEGVDKYRDGKTIVFASQLTVGGLWMSRGVGRHHRKELPLQVVCPDWRRFILDEDENGIEAIEQS